MKLMTQSIFVCAWIFSLPAWAQEANGCPAGSYAVVVSPDGATVSLLFDKFTVESTGILGGTSPRKVCRISAPLNLPENHSIGVYKVDYRGFAKLVAKQRAHLEVQYFLGPHPNQNDGDNNHGRVFKRSVKGPYEDDYLFTETIGAGQMKRAGCGAATALNVSITLSLDRDQPTDGAMASLDTTDGNARAALVYHVDLKKCH